MIKGSQKPSYRNLIDAGEPFRLLFPLGTALAILGLVLWPLWVWGIIRTYPGPAHSRIMIEGYMTAFVLGFLGTAFPRLVDVPGFRVGHACTWSGLLLLLSLFHLGGMHLAGDLLYLVLLGLFLASIGRRLRHRGDMPPPAFVLVGGGILCAFAGSALQAGAQVIPAHLPQLAFPLARLLLYHAFLLFAVMGAGAFFMPRFFDLPNRQSLPESRTPSPEWKGRARFAAACGAAILVTFILEACGWFRSAYTLRSMVLVLYFVMEVPAFRKTRGGGSLALAARITLLALPAGYLLMAVFPAYQTALAHIILVTGFSLLAFTVAAWVLLGHSGQSRFFQARSLPFLSFLGLILLAMITRVTADWMPEVRFTHYAYASLAWIAGAFIWAMRFLPLVRQPDPEP